jgi:hypothetical protein
MDKQIRQIEALAAEAEAQDLDAEAKRWRVAQLTAEYVKREGISAREYDRRAGLTTDGAGTRIRAWEQWGAEAPQHRPRFWAVNEARRSVSREERRDTGDLNRTARREPAKVIAKAAEIIRERPELAPPLAIAVLNAPGAAREVAIMDKGALLAMRGAVEDAAETPAGREFRQHEAEQSRLRGQQFVRPIRQITASVMLLEAARELAKMLRDIHESGAGITKTMKLELKGLLAQMADDLELIEFMDSEVQP